MFSFRSLSPPKFLLHLILSLFLQRVFFLSPPPPPPPRRLLANHDFKARVPFPDSVPSRPPVPTVFASPSLIKRAIPADWLADAYLLRISCYIALTLYITSEGRSSRVALLIPPDSGRCSRPYNPVNVRPCHAMPGSPSPISAQDLIVAAAGRPQNSPHHGRPVPYPGLIHPDRHFSVT